LIRFYRAFQYLIIDEVDAFPYTFDEMLPRLATKACEPGCARLYLSATPSKELQRQLAKGRLSSYLIPARYHLHPLDLPKFKWSGPFEEQLARGELARGIRSWLARKIATDRRALLFVPTIKSGYQLQSLLKRCLRLEIDFVYSSDPERVEKVRDFKEGKGRFLITTMILERGVTIKDIDVAIFGAEHEVYEEAALVQISGRVGRSPQFPSGEIVFFHYGVTKAMSDARAQIKRMNVEKEKRGLYPELR
jgi:competence protein ComFA